MPTFHNPKLKKAPKKGSRKPKVKSGKGKTKNPFALAMSNASAGM